VPAATSNRRSRPSPATCRITRRATPSHGKCLLPSNSHQAQRFIIVRIKFWAAVMTDQFTEKKLLQCPPQPRDGVLAESPISMTQFPKFGFQSLQLLLLVL
jgi:hypothetical protein